MMPEFVQNVTTLGQEGGLLMTLSLVHGDENTQR